MKVQPHERRITNIKLASQEDLNILRELVEMAEDAYPGIGAWWNKIKSGFKDGTRQGLLISNLSREVVGGTVIKVGASAKICSMRIVEGARRKRYGQQLWDATVDHIRKLGYSRCHFTMPGDIWVQGWFASQPGVERIGHLTPKTFRRNDIEEIVCDP
ncbi:hypothetical protein ES703_36814 [subsurface metagenome]